MRASGGRPRVRRSKSRRPPRRQWSTAFRTAIGARQRRRRLDHHLTRRAPEKRPDCRPAALVGLARRDLGQKLLEKPGLVAQPVRPVRLLVGLVSRMAVRAALPMQCRAPWHGAPRLAFAQAFARAAAILRRDHDRFWLAAMVQPRPSTPVAPASSRGNEGVGRNPSGAHEPERLARRPRRWRW